MTQPNLMGQVECGEAHPRATWVTCDQFGPHAKHEGTYKAGNHQKRLAWSPTALIGHDELRARRTDPASSQEAARRDFGITGGANGLARDILEVLTDRWMTCREIIEAVFGPGPYTYDQAVSLNKIQTLCLKMYREGLIERRDLAGEVLRYRVAQ